MNQPKNHNRIIPFITLTILASFAFANFAFAQTANSKLNMDSYKQAGRDKTYCEGEFRQNVNAFGAKVYPGSKFTTFYYSNPYTGGIVKALPGIGLTGYSSDRCIVKEIQTDSSGKEVGTADSNNAGILEQKIANAKTPLDPAKFTSSVAADEAQKSGLAAQFVGRILKGIFSSVTAILSSLSSMLGRLITWTMSTAPTAQVSPIVNIGWTIIRDIMNMAFILIMIIIALGSILGLENFDYKHLLGRVVMMAILVNFSKVIVISIIGISDLVAQMFLSPTILQGYLAEGTKVIDSYNTTGLVGTVGSYVVQAATAFILAFIMLYAYLSIAILFVIRLVGLWVLIILSPLACVAYILPATEKYAEEWISYFIKYLIWPPVALFFLRLGSLLIEYKNQGKFSSGADSIFDYVIIMSFMFIAVYMAKEAGMIGGEVVIERADKIRDGMSEVARGYVGRKYNELTSGWLEGHGAISKRMPAVVRKAGFAVFNPLAFGRGLKERGEELGKMEQDKAKAGGREVGEQLMTTPLMELSSIYKPWRIPGRLRQSWKKGGRLKIPYRQFVERAEENKFLKDYGEMKKESLMRAAVELDGMEGPEAEIRKRSIVKAAAQAGYLDDLLRMKTFANKYADKDGTTYSAVTLNRFLHGYLGDNEQAKRFMAEDMDELGKKVKHFEYLGHAYYDPATQKWENGMKRIGGQRVTRGGKTFEIDIMGQGTTRGQADYNHQAAYAASEFAKLGGRDRVNIAPHNITVIRSELTGGATDDFANPNEELGEDMYYKADGSLDVSQRAILEKMDSDVAREAQHAQERVKERVLSADFDKDKQEVIVHSEGELKKIRVLYAKNREYVTGMYYKEQGKDPRNNLEAAQNQAQRGDYSGYNIKYRLVDPRTGATIRADTINTTNTPDTYVP